MVIIMMTRAAPCAHPRIILIVFVIMRWLKDKGVSDATTCCFIQTRHIRPDISALSANVKSRGGSRRVSQDPFYM